jgi:hypothetical protein
LNQSWNQCRNGENKTQKQCNPKVSTQIKYKKENAEKQKELDQGKFGGVPFFYNTETEEHICGEAEMEVLREWATGI